MWHFTHLQTYVVYLITFTIKAFIIKVYTFVKPVFYSLLQIITVLIFTFHMSRNVLYLFIQYIVVMGKTYLQLLYYTKTPSTSADHLQTFVLEVYISLRITNWELPCQLKHAQQTISLLK